MSDWYNNLRDIWKQRLLVYSQLEMFTNVSPGEIKADENGSTTFNEQGLSFTWVKLRGNDASRVAALNMTSITIDGTPVLVARDPKHPYLWQILGPDPAYIRADMALSISQYGTSIHGSNHQTADEADPGPDPVYVFQPMLYLLKTVGDGATLTVSTHPYDYNKGDISRYFAGADTDLTSSVPGAGLVRKVLLYLDRDTNVLETVEGTTVLDNGVIPIPLPLPPAGVTATKSAWVTLANGQTTITTATDVDDARDFLNTGQDDALPAPTGPAQVLMTDNGSLPFWATPVIDEVEGTWMAGDDNELVWEG